MKKRFTGEQEADSSVALKEVCRKHGISTASYYFCQIDRTDKAVLTISFLSM